MYNGNYKTLKKEIEEGTQKWKNLPCFLIGRIDIISMPILSKEICRFNMISVKTSIDFLEKKMMLIFIWKYKRHQIATAIVNSTKLGMSEY